MTRERRERIYIRYENPKKERESRETRHIYIYGKQQHANQGGKLAAEKRSKVCLRIDSTKKLRVHHAEER